MPIHGLQIPKRSVKLYSASASKAPNSTIPQLFSKHSRLPRITAYFGHLDAQHFGQRTLPVRTVHDAPLHYNCLLMTSVRWLPNGCDKESLSRPTQLTMEKFSETAQRSYPPPYGHPATDGTATEANNRSNQVIRSPCL